MANLLLLVVIGAAAGLVAWYLTRSSPDPPVATGAPIPLQLDRGDFDRPAAPWLLATFTSTTCDTCAEVVTKVAPLASDEVVVQELAYQSDRAVHDRYRIESVPLVLIADREGVVRHHVLGPVNASELRASMAQLREPGSRPPGRGG